MAEIVKQRRDHRDLGPPRIECFADAGDFPLDDAHQFARDVEDADGMDEARVGGAGEDELGQAELLDPPQALELRRVDEPPGQLVDGLSFAKTIRPWTGRAGAGCETRA